MSLTIVFYWWYVPLLCLIAAFVLLWIGSGERGMFGGIEHFLGACAFFLAAIVSGIVGWLK